MVFHELLSPLGFLMLELIDFRHEFFGACLVFLVDLVQVVALLFVLHVYFVDQVRLPFGDELTGCLAPLLHLHVFLLPFLFLFFHGTFVFAYGSHLPLNRLVQIDGVLLEFSLILLVLLLLGGEHVMSHILGKLHFVP